MTVGGLAVLLSATIHAATAPGAPIGDELQIGENDQSTQYPALATAPDGSFVVVWQSVGDTALYGRHYEPSGTPRGPAFRIAANTGNNPALPSIAFDGAGNYAVVWETAEKTVYCARYDAGDHEQNPGSVVSYIEAGDDSTIRSPKLASDRQGNLTAVWSQYSPGAGAGNVYMRRLQADNGVGAITRLSANDAGAEASVAMNADGKAVVLWRDNDPDQFGYYKIYGQRLAADGSLQGAIFRADTVTAKNTLYSPVVAMDAAGGFVAAWRHMDSEGHSLGNLVVRRFDATGAGLGDEAIVNGPDSVNYYANFDFYPAIAMRPLGDFAVAWVSGSEKIRVRFYGADGHALGDEQAGADRGNVTAPAAAMDVDGNLLVASAPWLPSTNSAKPGHVHRFSGVENVDLAAALSGAPAPVAAGGEVAYTLFVDNRHAPSTGTYSGQSTGLAADITLGGAAFEHADGDGWSCSGLGPVHCRYDAVIPAGGTAAALTLTARASPGVAAATATARLNGNQYDANGGNDLATVSTAIGGGTVLTGSVQFNTANYTVAENGGAAVVTVSRVGGSDGAVSVHVTSEDREALAGSDYGTVDATLDWPDGDAAPKTLSVPIVDDQNAEPSKTFALKLDTPAGGVTLGAPITTTVTILDDDAPPPAAHGTLGFSANAYSAAEGARAELIVLRSGGSDGAASVDYATSGGNAVDGEDYTAASGTLTWADGDDAPKRILITTTADDVVEPDKVVNVTLSHAQGATLGETAGAALTIVNDDFAPTEPIVVKDSGGGAFGRFALVVLMGLYALRRKAG